MTDAPDRPPRRRDKRALTNAVRAAQRKDARARNKKRAHQIRMLMAWLYTVEYEEDFAANYAWPALVNMADHYLDELYAEAEKGGHETRKRLALRIDSRSRRHRSFENSKLFYRAQEQTWQDYGFDDYSPRRRKKKAAPDQ